MTQAIATRSATDDHYVTEPLLSEPMLELGALTPPAFAVPPGACDAHVHVFTPGFPHVPKPLYTLPDGRLPHFRALMGRLGLDRFVLVQPSFYGTDNACLLAALAEAGDAARGVVMLPEDAEMATYDALHEAGVRGLRLDLFARAHWARGDLAAFIRRMAGIVGPLGWHLQFYAPGPVVRDLLPTLARLDTPHVIDHMGYMLAADGLTPADFAGLLRLTVDGQTHLKLSGPYRVAKTGGYGAVAEVAGAICETARGRAIWGSDWPHIPKSSRDTGEILNLLADWAPDEAVRREILVDTPARLFGWAPG